METRRTLYRSRSERMIAGVCGGLADYVGLDPTLVRLIAVLLAVVGNAAAFIAYIVMWVVVPEEPVDATVRGSESVPTYEPLETPSGVATPAPPRPSAPQPPPARPGPPVVGFGEAGRATASSGHELISADRRGPGGGAVWLGVVFVAIGIFIITARLWPEVDVWALWPVIIVLLGVRTMVTRGSEGSWNVNRLVEGATGVVVGGILLANTTGSLGLSVWLSIASLWPLLLIAAGVDIIGKGMDNLWLRTLSSLIVLGGILVGVFFIHQQPLSMSMGLFGPKAEAFELSEPADAGVSSVKAEIKGAAGTIGVTSGDDLISAKGESPFGEATLDVTSAGGSAEAKLTMGEGESIFFYRGPAYMDVELSDDVRWDLSIDTGFSKLDADFADIDIRALSISTGVTDARITLGKPASGAGTIDVDIGAGVSSVTVRVPKDADVRVKTTSGVGTVRTPDGGGPVVGTRSWESDGYEKARDRYNVKVGTGVANVRVEYY